MDERDTRFISNLGWTTEEKDESCHLELLSFLLARLGSPSDESQPPAPNSRDPKSVRRQAAFLGISFPPGCLEQAENTSAATASSDAASPGASGRASAGSATVPRIIHELCDLIRRGDESAAQRAATSRFIDSVCRRPEAYGPSAAFEVLPADVKQAVARRAQQAAHAGAPPAPQQLQQRLAACASELAAARSRTDGSAAPAAAGAGAGGAAGEGTSLEQALEAFVEASEGFLPVFRGELQQWLRERHPPALHSIGPRASEALSAHLLLEKVVEAGRALKERGGGREGAERRTNENEIEAISEAHAAESAALADLLARCEIIKRGKVAKHW